jgi:hypothetical protein
MERDEFLRAAWRVMVAGELDPQRLVFVDEMGTNTALAPLYAWSKRGERVRMRYNRKLWIETSRGTRCTVPNVNRTKGVGTPDAESTPR